MENEFVIKYDEEDNPISHEYESQEEVYDRYRAALKSEKEETFEERKRRINAFRAGY